MCKDGWQRGRKRCHWVHSGEYKDAPFSSASAHRKSPETLVKELTRPLKEGQRLRLHQKQSCGTFMLREISYHEQEAVTWGTDTNPLRLEMISRKLSDVILSVKRLYTSALCSHIPRAHPHLLSIINYSRTALKPKVFPTNTSYHPHPHTTIRNRWCI